MSQKTRVLNVRVVGFSAPERQMLNSIFLLSVAPARQIGYKLWNSESGTAPDMYLLDGDSESAVASWQAAFSDAFERTLVVGSKNTDLGCTSAARPLGLKVVGAMDRLAIALNNMALNKIAKEPAGFDVSEPRAGTMPTGASDTNPPALPKPDMSLPPRVSTGMTAQHPALSASMNAPLPGASISAAAATLSATMTANATAPLPGGTLAPAGTLPTSMTATAPAATVLPSMTLQPIVSPPFEKTFNERPLTEKTIDKLLSDKLAAEKPAAPALPPISGATPLSPSALAAAVAPSPRANLRVVPPPSAMAASLPSAATTASFAARIAEAPMNPATVSPPSAPVNTPISVPVAAPTAFVPPPPVPASPVPVSPVSVPTPRHEEQVFRVLTVDDSPLMRTFLQNKLAPYGIAPEFAASGEEALYKISKQHFDLIFLDVMLPGMDGYDVCKMIKKNKDNNLMKVVMLTSKDKTFDKIRGTMAGCDGYLTKPVDEMKLRAIIERHTVTRK